jgi:hypothetical protein
VKEHTAISVPDGRGSDRSAMCIRGYKYDFLLVTQHPHRVYTADAPRREGAGQDRNYDEAACGQRESAQVTRLNVIELAAHEPGEPTDEGSEVRTYAVISETQALWR